jgi:hypothetical protein
VARIPETLHDAPDYVTYGNGLELVGTRSRNRHDGEGTHQTGQRDKELVTLAEHDRRPQDGEGDAPGAHLLLALPLRVRVAQMRRVLSPQGAQVNDELNPRVAGGSDDVARALHIDALKGALGGTLTNDGHQMRDGIDALHCRVQGPRGRHVPLDDLDPGTSDHCLPPAMHQGANDHTALGERGN